MKKLAIISLGILTACAGSPDKMSASYVSPLQYQSYDCQQIGAELQRVTRHASELYGQLKKTSNDDNAQMAVGLVLFWPALFFLEGGDGPQAVEYQRLKGERDALEQAAIEKKCDPSIIPPMQQPEPEKKEPEQPKRNYNKPVRDSTQKPD